MQAVVISLGGSLVAPDGVDVGFLRELLHCLRIRKNTQFILVVGGGRPARTYQDAAREFGASNTDLDWVGIRATYLNAELVRTALGTDAHPEIVTNPSKPPKTKKQFVICSGWKPGWSTDYDAVLLATKYKTTTVINLSNIDAVFDRDPRTSVAAQQFPTLSWTNYLKMVGTTWEPGKNCPFDPIASKLAKQKKITVIIANGRNVVNLNAILDGKVFAGTTLS